MPTGPKRRLRMQVRATPENGPGTGKAVVSVIGLEYDVGWGWTEIILPGCFDESIETHPTIPIYHQHNWDDGPIGSGTPSIEGDQLIVTFGLYLGMGDLVDRVYRAMQDKALEEWSIGFWADEITWEKDNPSCDQIAKGDLAESSVCVRGANPETGTLELAARGAGWIMGDEEAHGKELSRIRSMFPGMPDLRDLADRRARAAIAVHHTGTSTGTWDGPAQETNLSNDDGASVYKLAYAWVDPDKDADTKAAYKFIHHIVTDGTPGDASTVACSSGIGVLNGARSGTTIPDADIQGVYDHLAAHLKDADITPPELKSDSLDGMARVLEAFLASAPDSHHALEVMQAAMAAALRASDDEETEPTPADLAQSLDALIDQVVLLLEADPPDTKGALDLLVGADSTCDDLLEALGVPDDDDIAGSEERARRLRTTSDGCPATSDCGHPASVHDDTDAGDNMGPCSTPGCECPGAEDPADDESAKSDAAAQVHRLLGTPHGRKLLLLQSGVAT